MAMLFLIAAAQWRKDGPAGVGAPIIPINGTIEIIHSPSVWFPFMMKTG